MHIDGLNLISEFLCGPAIAGATIEITPQPINMINVEKANSRRGSNPTTDVMGFEPN